MRPENTLLHAGFEPSEDAGQQVGGEGSGTSPVPGIPPTSRRRAEIELALPVGRVGGLRIPVWVLAPSGLQGDRAGREPSPDRSPRLNQRVFGEGRSPDGRIGARVGGGEGVEAVFANCTGPRDRFLRGCESTLHGVTLRAVAVGVHPSVSARGRWALHRGRMQPLSSTESASDPSGEGLPGTG